MAQRITKHSTRLSQVHEGALDTPFKTGDRVQTIDGLPGRVLFVSASFAPGVTEYEVALDSGMGQGVYTASQLRPIPADYRGGSSPVPPGLLPAGVTAAIEAEGAEMHLASDDYPEMGSVLTDRPDPGRHHRVIGGLQKTAADSYRGDHDPREEDYNGGENDSGTYWAEPGQQDWMHGNEPQEPAPPPPWAAMMESPVLARLAQIEEARQFFGTLRQETVPARRYATTINGTQIDEHGDAPEHGTTPRATAPDSYDARSTEGDGDPRWSGQDDPQMRDKNGAAVGMYPEGMSAGGGPGLEIGAFTAHMYGDVEGTHATEQHLIAEHGVTPAELSDLRLRSWNTYPQELHSAHTRVSGGRPLDDWHGSTWLAHGRPMDASELQGHLAYQHGIHLPADYAPGELAREHNSEHERNEFAGQERTMAGAGSQAGKRPRRRTSTIRTRTPPPPTVPTATALLMQELWTTCRARGARPVLQRRQPVPEVHDHGHDAIRERRLPRDAAEHQHDPDRPARVRVPARAVDRQGAYPAAFLGRCSGSRLGRLREPGSLHEQDAARGVRPGCRRGDAGRSGAGRLGLSGRQRAGRRPDRQPPAIRRGALDGLPQRASRAFRSPGGDGADRRALLALGGGRRPGAACQR